jgi:hypothetical protein
MIEHDPIGNDSRRRKQVARLGRDPACLFCLERDPDRLRRVKKTLLEEHHVAGKSNDRETTVILCRNCHWKLTAQMFRGGIQLVRDDERSIPEKAEQFLLGLALFFEMLAAACEDWAMQLGGHVRALDANLPQWRQLPDTGM